MNCVNEKLYLSSSFRPVLPEIAGTSVANNPVMFFQPSGPTTPLVVVGALSNGATYCNNLSSSTGTTQPGVANLTVAGTTAIGTGWYGAPAASPECDFTFDMICVAQMPAMPQ